jgi:hypothetical protein
MEILGNCSNQWDGLVHSPIPWVMILLGKTLELFCEEDVCTDILCQSLSSGLRTKSAEDRLLMA